MKKAIIALVFLSAITPFSKLQAQDPDVTQGNLNSWFLLMNRFYLSDKFAISNELHERTGNFFQDQAIFIFRPSVDYRLNHNTELSVGYSYVRSWPYEPYTLPVPINEHNIWEQVLFHFNTGKKVTLQNRIRFEHRFIDNVEKIPLTDDYIRNGTNFSNRFRFRFVASFDLLHLQNDKTIFFNSFNEIWINQSDNLMPSSFARNWIYTGLGYRLSKDFNMQLGHMHQYDKVAPNTYISSSIIQLSVFKNFDLRRFKQ